MKLYIFTSDSYDWSAVYDQNKNRIYVGHEFFKDNSLTGNILKHCDIEYTVFDEIDSDNFDQEVDDILSELDNG